MFYRCLLVFGIIFAAATRSMAQTPEWIWSSGAPADTETRVFRKSFTAPAGVNKVQLILAADNEAEVKLDGASLAKNSEWAKPTRFTANRPLPAGPHTLEVAARNDGSAAGLLLKFELIKADRSRETIVTDGSWEVSANGRDGWVAATSLGKLGVAPWGDVTIDPVATPASALQVADGFQVELLRSAEPSEGSWVSLTVDPQGRFIISPQGNEPLLRVTLNAAGKVAQIEPLPVAIRGAMGLLCAFDALYANAQGPDGYHLYRITDTNGDDQYDRVELLRKWNGGPGEHGAHGIVRGPDDHLYIIAGNFVEVPTDLQPGSPVRNYRDDLVLPRLEDGNGFGANRKPPGGYVLRVDKDGRNAELFASGQRNTYDLAFNPDGELFGFDSDMEWDWGAPWYRPTRAYHIVNGGDQGFREGSGKWPADYADSLPAVVNIGIGSPTGVRSGTGANFPEKYQRALYLLDWSYGRILAVFLQPTGASYTGSFETFVKGKPLNVTDLEVGKDGAMYFTTGGRGTQSGLYRVSYTRPQLTPSAIAAQAEQGASQSRQSRTLRHELETFHGVPDPRAIKVAWPQLGSSDRHLRFAARLAIEAQPVATWRDQALAETNAAAGLTAFLALARYGSPEDQVPLLKALTRWPLDSLDDEWKLNKLRVIEVSFARHGIPEELRPLAREKLGVQYPAKNWPLNRELSALLVALDAPDAVAKTLALRDAASTQEEQLHYQVMLRKAQSGWTPELRQRYFAWFTSPTRSPGSDASRRSTQHPPEFVQWFQDVGLQPGNGSSFDNFLKNIRREAFEAVPDAEKAPISLLIASQAPASATAVKARPFVKEWKTEDLQPTLGEASKGRNYARGQEIYASAQCAVCHRFHGEGGATGPDLTGIGTRYSPVDVLKALTEPSAVVSEQYQNTIFTLNNGDEVVGRIVEETPVALVIVTDPLKNTREEVKKTAVKSRAAARLSPMPEGLLNNFSKAEILDLLAYLQSDGKKEAAAFKP